MDCVFTNRCRASLSWISFRPPSTSFSCTAQEGVSGNRSYRYIIHLNIGDHVSFIRNDCGVQVIINDDLSSIFRNPCSCYHTRNFEGRVNCVIGHNINEGIAGYSSCGYAIHNNVCHFIPVSRCHCVCPAASLIYKNIA